MFDKVLRAFDTGGFTYADLQAQLKRLLAGGASPAELLEILRRHESTKPLPDFAHLEVQGVLNEAAARAATQEKEVGIDLNQAMPRVEGAGQKSTPAPGSALASTLSAVSEFIRPSGEGPRRAARQNSDYEALTRSYEQSRDAEAAANARAAALATDLAAAQTALESEQSKIRKIAQAFAERTAFAEAARSRSEEAQLELQDHQAEVQQMRESLGARDAELAALHEDHAKLMRALEARAATTPQLENDLQAALTRASSLAAELAAAQAALQAQQGEIQDIDRELAEKIAARDAQLAALQQEHTKLVRALDAQESALAAERTAAEAARSRIEEALRESLRESQELQTESRQLRDALGARDAQLATLQQEHTKVVRTLEARASALVADLGAAQAALQAQQGEIREIDRDFADKVGARDAQLAALQQDHTKLVRVLDERSVVATQLQADLRAAHSQIEAISLELRASQGDAAALRAQLKRGESHLAGAQTELGAVKSQSSSYLELLRTREWRRGFAHVLSPDAEVPIDATEAINPPATNDTAPAQDITPARIGRGEKRPAFARWVGWSAAALVLVIIGWFFVRPGPVATPPAAPLPVAASVPAPVPGAIILDCPTCPTMKVLAPGRFKQGTAGAAGAAGGSASFEMPLHWVLIARPFAMSMNAVTVDEFHQFIAATGRDMQGCDTYDGEWKHRPKSSWENPGFAQTGAHPVTCVSWQDAKAYADWLSTTTGHRYRLPSASEWEYAARAGSDAAQPWNADRLGACADANVADASAARRYPGWSVFPCDDGYAYTAPVGSFKANSFGLNDMLGNVFQWTDDCWHTDYNGAPIDGTARTDGDCSERELRGGSWFSSPPFVRVNSRNHFAADYRTSSVGIRLVREIES